MRSSALIAATLAASLLANCQTSRADDQKTPKSIAWAKSYSEAVELAKKANKPIMIDFYTDWCGWCKVLDEKTYTDAKVIRKSGDFISVKLDAERDGINVARKYKDAIAGFPTILFIDANIADPVAEVKPSKKGEKPAKDVDASDESAKPGKVKEGEIVGKVVGFLPPEGFLQEMTKIIKSVEDLPKLTARVKKDPKDLQAIADLAAIHQMRGNGDRAAELLKQGEALDPENAKGFLTPAYNAVGDLHQMKGEFDKAIPLFEKAARTGKDPHDVAYAPSSIAACYLSQGKLKEAVPELEAVIKLKDVPKGDKEQAEGILKQVNQALGAAKTDKDKDDK